MKKHPNIILILLLGLFVASCGQSPIEINCDFDEQSFIKKIKKDYLADTVLFYSKRLQEEAYFPEIRALTLVIENPTTTIVDFKELSLETTTRFDNWDEIDSSLKAGGLKYATELVEYCEMKEFNDIIIEFGKSK